MIRRSILLAVFLGGILLALDTSFGASGDIISSVVNCDGTQVIRTNIGQLQIIHGEKNAPGCVGTRTVDTVSHSGTASSPTVIGSTNTGNIQNNSGNTLQSETEATEDDTGVTLPKFNPDNGPALDIRSTDIVHYRVQRMANKGIRYVDPTWSVKMRHTPSMLSRVVSYLLKNDAVVISGKETGWVKTVGALIDAPDTVSNEVVPDTDGKSSGYIASGYLRLPNASDLVRIRQADQAYWSDIAHIRVAHLVNVREHPYYGAHIVATLTDRTPLYIVSTVNNWSEVISDDRSISGYIRSDYLVVDQAQRVDR